MLERIPYVAPPSNRESGEDVATSARNVPTLFQPLAIEASKQRNEPVVQCSAENDEVVRYAETHASKFPDANYDPMKFWNEKRHVSLNLICF